MAPAHVVTARSMTPLGRWWLLGPETVFALVVQWPLRLTDGPVFLAANILVAVAFFATGLVIGIDPVHGGTGRALLAAGVIWPLNWLNEWQVGPLPLIAALIGPLASVLAVWALLRYPVLWPRRRHDLAAAAMLAFVQVAAVAVVVLSRPEWHGLDPSAPWLTLWPSMTAWHFVTIWVYDAGGAMVAIIVLIGFALRYRRLHGFDRRAMRPVVIAFILACALTAVADVGTSLELSWSIEDRLYLVQALVLVLVPLGFLTSAVRRWLALGNLPRLGARLRMAKSGRDLQAVLRQSLDDPSIMVLYHNDQPNSAEWLDVEGHPIRDDARAGRYAVDLMSSLGVPLGVVLGADGLYRHATFVEPVLRTAARVVETAGLEAQIRARIAETNASAARLATILAVEERRILDDLRLGPQRHLDSAAARLAALPSLDGTSTLRAMIAVVKAQLDDLAVGNVPADVTERGLGPALTRMLAGQAEVNLPAQRFPHDIEAAAYFAVVESVVNATKHAAASRISVNGAMIDGSLTVAVLDNGCGGADPQGAGLTGIRDRVAAVGGLLTVGAAPHGGTLVKMEVPYRSERRSDVPAEE